MLIILENCGFGMDLLGDLLEKLLDLKVFKELKDFRGVKDFKVFKV